MFDKVPPVQTLLKSTSSARRSPNTRLAICTNPSSGGAFCGRQGIRTLRLFGSTARSQLRDDRDIDLLVEFEPDRTPGPLGIATLELELEELLGRDVNLRTTGHLSPYFSDEIVATARLL